MELHDSSKQQTLVVKLISLRRLSEHRGAQAQFGPFGCRSQCLCFGTDLIGSKIDRQTSFQLLDLFRESGGTFLDTGNFYAAWLPGCAGGESETTIGLWMKERGNRHAMAIASKLGFDYPGCQGGLSAAEIERECEKSLQRLGTDRLDLYYAHRDDSQTPLEESMEAFDSLIRAGKVRAIGASNLRAWRIAEASSCGHEDGLCLDFWTSKSLPQCTTGTPGCLRATSKSERGTAGLPAN